MLLWSLILSVGRKLHSASDVYCFGLIWLKIFDYQYCEIDFLDIMMLSEHKKFKKQRETVQNKMNSWQDRLR